MKRNVICAVLSILLLFAAVVPYYMSTGTSVKYAVSKGTDAAAGQEYPTGDIILEEQKIAEEKRIAEEKLKVKISNEMRGIWIPYLSLQGINAETIDKMVADCVQMKVNTVFFHVRPFGDALYKSNYFPWSHLITGEQGKAPEDDFDPLKYMIEQCRKNGLKIHAWINPLRIRSNAEIPVLSQNNPAYIAMNDSDMGNDRYVISYNDGLYYNPAKPEVRALIVSGVEEIVQNYDVDGIHFDDYFYPAENENFNDSVEYEVYKSSGGTLTLQEWRRDNINLLISDVYKAVKAKKPNAVFGISPSGNIDNCMKMGADVKKWCSEPGYVDYICPQIYWSFEHKTLPFDKACEQWMAIKTCKDVKLYAGLALYKAGSDLDDGTWQTSSDNIKRQIEYLRKTDAFEGFALYSYQSVFKAECQEEIAAYKSL